MAMSKYGDLAQVIYEQGLSRKTEAAGFGDGLCEVTFDDIQKACLVDMMRSLRVLIAEQRNTIKTLESAIKELTAATSREQPVANYKDAIESCREAIMGLWREVGGLRNDQINRDRRERSSPPRPRKKAKVKK